MVLLALIDHLIFRPKVQRHDEKI